MRQISNWLCTFALVSLLPTRLSAQLAEGGIARDAARGTPYECLHVALLDSSGKIVEHAVTDSAGRFLLEAPRPGVYRVQFVIPGAEPLSGPADTLNEGDFK
ncbi:MAG: carboxypeptidase regulatory-like domain-containing protein, partial [Gemmatimonadetes bacterium]|nr:carboxypeptidase regulatory-like domain-containing protein [Gemmatimonadota bacterium]